MNASHPIILASGSPRRHALMRSMGYRCTVIPSTIAEEYPPHLPIAHVPVYLAKKKAFSVQNRIAHHEMVLAADTVVVLRGKMLNKPINREMALGMLAALSGKEHTVITGVCILDKRGAHCFSDETKVRFKTLKREEMVYYVDRVNPYDKAGGYGIQDWMGMIGVEAIRGAYTTVMGLPTHKVYSYMEKCRSVKAVPGTGS